MKIPDDAPLSKEVANNPGLLKGYRQLVNWVKILGLPEITDTSMFKAAGHPVDRPCTYSQFVDWYRDYDPSAGILPTDQNVNIESGITTPISSETAHVSGNTTPCVLKDTNPKDAIGCKKAPLSCVPAPIIFELGLAMLEGACKYGRHNYRAVGVRSSIYYDACLRHLMAWWEGEDVDEASGLSHLVKAMACLLILRDSQRQGMLTDDRPPKSADGWVEELNEKAKTIIDRLSDYSPYHYTQQATL